MKRCFIILCVIIVMVLASSTEAKPRRGFNTGPYLAIEVGAGQNDFDTNQRTGERVGTDFEPTVGFLFGWNIYDWISAEISGRYATSKVADKREQIAGANLNTKFFLITDALTDFPTLRILPFVKAGVAFKVVALPGDTSAVKDDVLTSFAYGPSVGGGIMFLWKKYVYLGFNVQGDFLFFEDKYQDINNGGTSTNTLIYKGGFIPQVVTTAILGVHF
jgi:hypothetical protein